LGVKQTFLTRNTARPIAANIAELRFVTAKARRPDR
jgi:hypothetical protein